MIPSAYPPHLPEVILFDWDDTLVDTRHVSFQSINITLQTLGRPPLLWEPFVQQPSLSAREYFPTLFSAEELPKAHHVFRQALMEQHLAALIPTAGAHALLTWIQTQRIPMGVVSNKEGTILRKEIAHLQWESFFKCAVGSYDTPHDKPSPIPLYHALQAFSVDPGHHVWFVGDSIVDMMCAKNASCVPVSVGPQADLHPHPTVQAKHCIGLHQLLQTLPIKQPA